MRVIILLIGVLALSIVSTHSTKGGHKHSHDHHDHHHHDHDHGHHHHHHHNHDHSHQVKNPEVKDT